VTVIAYALVSEVFEGEGSNYYSWWRQEMFTLKIVFVGLIAIVDQSTSGSVTALLVDARDAAKHPQTGVHEHQPFLAFPMENWNYAAAGGVKPDIIATNEYGDEIGFVFLDMEELTFTPTPETPLKVVKGVSGGSFPGSDAEAFDVKWAMAMANLNHASCRYDRLCSNCLVGPVQAPLVARVRLDRGLISTARVGRQRQTGAYHTFEFVPSPAVWFDHALAGKIEASMAILGREIKVETSTGRFLVLRTSSFASTVHLVIGNLPLDHKVFGVASGFLDDFLWYYDLVEGIDAECTRPIPVDPPGGTTSGAGVFCPQVQF